MRNPSKPKAGKKQAPAKAARPARAPVATTTPRVRVPTVLIPQGDGSYLVKTGAPVLDHDEIGTREFARRANISQDHACRLCDLGVIRCRRKSPRPHSSYLIPASEVERFRAADPHEFKEGQ